MKLIKSEKYQGNYHRFTVECSYKENVKLFVCSDVHFDNVKCNRKLFFEHMDKALEQNALIAITGDFFCLMQGKYDPRSNKSAIRPEHNGDNYLDLVINDAAEKMKKYAKNILIISKGNHETSVSGRCETSIMDRFVERLNMLAEANVQVGQYTGYYTICFKSNGSKRSLDIGYSHGNWGGVITKGTLSVVRYASIMPDCDIMFSGHTHDGWIVTHPRLRKNYNTKKVEVKNQWHVKTGTYKEEFAQGKGWAVERIAMPKYLGGCFVDIDYNQSKDLKYTCSLTY